MGSALRTHYSALKAIKGSRFADILTGDAGNNFFEPLGGADAIDWW